MFRPSCGHHQVYIKDTETYEEFLISDFRRDLNIENVLLGISPASSTHTERETGQTYCTQ